MDVSIDTLLKILIGVASGFLGWVLAQLTSGVRTWIQRRRVLRLLLQELGDLDVEIDRLLLFFSRQLQIHAAGGVSSETIAGLSNPVFRGYYKDALLSLNQRQRISYQLIHSMVKLANVGIMDLRVKSSEIYARYAVQGMSEELKKVCDAWGKVARAQFLSCSSLQWHVRFHLENPRSPDLSPRGKPGAQYASHIKAAQERVGALVAAGEKIDLNTFEQASDLATR